MQVVRNQEQPLESVEPKNRTERKSGEKKQKIRIRLIPIWARILIVGTLLIGATAAGTMVGYAVIGDGKASDVFKKATWTHISDLVNKDTPSHNK